MGEIGSEIKCFCKKISLFEEHAIPIFDSLLITPFWLCIKKRAYTQFHKYLQVVERYGISKALIYNRLLVFVFFLLKNKINTQFSS